MRIIDADEIKNLQWILYRGYNDACREYVTIEGINTLPTIEAIPVEWIKEIVEVAEKVGADKYAEDLRILLADWREENED